MNNELFSIIMPAFNVENTIGISISSVLNQTNNNFRLYIINDASNDNTKNIIKSFSDDRIVYIENNKNLGVSKSRNIGIQSCQGKYIAFLDSDDIWLPTKLEEQLVFLENGWDVVCSNYISFDEKLNKKERLSPEIINYTDMFKTNLIGNLTGVYNRERLGKNFTKRNWA
ncbi:MAG TPA: glycosyltransferase family 2 protein [Arsenophonus nasoniae]|uniref:glycosyltransferase family 2 protein n=2 Tax=Arsenophonus nasoniae TaxID=638 RepID=UPI0038791438